MRSYYFEGILITRESDCSYADYVVRLQGIHSRVKQTEAKLKALQYFVRNVKLFLWEVGKYLKGVWSLFPIIR